MEENASMPLAGGIMQHGYQCGMIWGAAIAAGAQAYRLHGKDVKGQAKAIQAAKGVVDAFIDEKGTINCMEITDLNESSTNWQMLNYFLLKGGTIGCFKLANKFAPKAYETINVALSEEIQNLPESLPVSCTSMLAERMGLTDEQKMMVSGFAGGIGLCGGACGALGVAIWVNAMRSSIINGSKVEFKDPKGMEVITEFLKKSDYQFECKEIVGKIFKDVKDHADYIQNGGCAELIELLASELTAKGS